MRKIIHVDMDCFYAAVEVKHNPKLQGLPIGIGGPPESRSVLCTANYEARKFGVKAAMPSSQALRLCPDLILVPPHFDLYKAESQSVRKIFERFTDQIEPLSLDEAYLDVTQNVGIAQDGKFCGSASLLAKEIRRCIQSELGLTASAGIAPNKFLAKIASDWKKPNGQFVISPQEIEKFMPELKIEKIYGVGKVTAKHMHQLGIFTCGDIQKKDLPWLNAHFGSRGPELLRFAHGIDERPVQTKRERKSLSVETTFSQDIPGLSALLERAPKLFDELGRRLTKGNWTSLIRGFVVKLKYHDFKTQTHETSQRGEPTLEDFTRLLKSAWQKRSDPVRLLGFGVRIDSLEPDANPAPEQQLSFENSFGLPSELT